MDEERQLSWVLSDLAATLTTDFPITAVLNRLVERITEVVPVTSAGLSLIEAGLPPRHLASSDAAARRFEQLQSDLGEGPCVLACESGEAVSVPDLARDTRFPSFGPAAVAAGLGAVFAFPLRQPGGRFGAMDLYLDTPRDLDEQTMAAAWTLADVAAAYLLSAEARSDAEHLRHVATHDELTGLPNKLMLQSRIEHAGRRALRSGGLAAILFIDLDRFKRVNDTYGHDVGDGLLRGVADRLSQLIRPGDTLARMYGDEFVLLCEDISHLTDVEDLVNRIRLSFTAPFEVAGIELTISTSVGVAFVGPGQELSTKHIAEADSAMYADKRKGRGRQVTDLFGAERSARPTASS